MSDESFGGENSRGGIIDSIWILSTGGGGVDGVGVIGGSMSVFSSCAILINGSGEDSGCKAGIYGVPFNNKWIKSFEVLQI